MNENIPSGENEDGTYTILWSNPVSVDPEPEYCGVYWIITTCLTAIAIGIWLGMVLWLISGEHR